MLKTLSCALQERNQSINSESRIRGVEVDAVFRFRPSLLLFAPTSRTTSFQQPSSTSSSDVREVRNGTAICIIEASRASQNLKPSDQHRREEFSEETGTAGWLLAAGSMKVLSLSLQTKVLEVI